MNRKTFILGSRGSLLALWQAEWVKAQLAKKVPGIDIEIKKISTTGDKFRGANWADAPGKGVFTKEIEEALLANKIDFAVHSLKDVPTDLPKGLHLAAIPKREDAHDVLILNRELREFNELKKTKPPTAYCLQLLRQGAKIGTSSLRRQSQLLHYRPDLIMENLRGNLNTRVEKLEWGAFDAIIVAAAGLNRLQITNKLMAPIPFKIMLPAVGQGALAIECRIADNQVTPLVIKLNDKPTELAVTAERAFLAGLGGGCRLPIAAYAEIKNNRLILDGLVASPDGANLIRAQAQTKILNLASAVSLGKRLGEKLLNKNAKELLNH
ncbi:MAG: hydroxymethylbilane synthase [bacterium]|nr:hydroxymethylbilane synthase [bacterium]